MKILHADEHTLFRDGLHHILSTLDEDMEFLEAEDLSSTHKILTAHDDIDVVLLDYQLNGLNGFITLKTLCASYPSVPIVLLTAYEDRGLIKKTIESGIAGYIPKSVSTQTLLSALRIVMDGGVYAPRMPSHPPAHDGPAMKKPRHSTLTRRQLEVLALMSQGLSNKLIANELFVSEATVKGHVTAILDILGVSNRVQAINKIRANGNEFSAAWAPPEVRQIYI